MYIIQCIPSLSTIPISCPTFYIQSFLCPTFISISHYLPHLQDHTCGFKYHSSNNYLFPTTCKVVSYYNDILHSSSFPATAILLLVQISFLYLRPSHHSKPGHPFSLKSMQPPPPNLHKLQLHSTVTAGTLHLDSYSNTVGP